MNRIAAFILTLAFLALGSGTLLYVHNLQHEAEDAREDAIVKAMGLPAEQHNHNDSNCDVHAQLHMALLLTSWVPFLILLGLFVAFLTLLQTPRIRQLSPARIDCRGPPLR